MLPHAEGPELVTGRHFLQETRVPRSRRRSTTSSTALMEQAMSQIEIIEKPGHRGKESARTCGRSMGHYPEFREFFIRRFALELWSVQGRVRPCTFGNGLFARVRGSKWSAVPRWAGSLCVVDALEPLSEEDLDTDLWAFLRWMILRHWRRMEGRRPRCNRPVISASVFCPDRVDRWWAPAHPFPWKMQRMNTSTCGAASTTRVANALPVTA